MITTVAMTMKLPMMPAGPIPEKTFRGSPNTSSIWNALPQR